MHESHFCGLEEETLEPAGQLHFLSEPKKDGFKSPGHSQSDSSLTGQPPDSSVGIKSPLHVMQESHFCVSEGETLVPAGQPHWSEPKEEGFKSPGHWQSAMLTGQPPILFMGIKSPLQLIHGSQ